MHACGVLHFGGIQRLTCCATSASADLFGPGDTCQTIVTCCSLLAERRKMWTTKILATGCAGYLEKMNYSNATLILVHFIDAGKSVSTEPCLKQVPLQIASRLSFTVSVHPPVRLFSVCSSSTTESSRNWRECCQLTCRKKLTSESQLSFIRNCSENG